MKNPDLLKVKNILDTLETDRQLDIVSYVSVWSNGNKIRRFTGQGEDTAWHNPKDSYRKMVAILVEIDGINIKE